MIKITKLELRKPFPNRNIGDVLLKHTDSVHCTKYYWENDGKELDSVYFDSSYFSEAQFRYEYGTLCFVLSNASKDLFREHIVKDYFPMLQRHAVDTHPNSKFSHQLKTSDILPFKIYWFIDSKGRSNKGYYFDSFEGKNNVPMHYKKAQELYKYRKAVGNVFDTNDNSKESKLYYENVTI